MFFIARENFKMFRKTTNILRTKTKVSQLLCHLYLLKNEINKHLPEAIMKKQAIFS